MKWANRVKFQKGNNKTLVANINKGTRFFVSNECLNYINEWLNSSYSLEIFLTRFEEEDDRKYMNDLVQLLLELDMINEYEEDIVPINEIRLSWDITNKCNLKCAHCCVSAGEDKRGEELETSKLLQIADKIINLNPYSICISGGEPLIRRDFNKIIDYIKSKYNGNLQLMTNGLLIDKEMAKYIVKNFYSVDISIDGVDEETCSEIRGEGVFENIIESIKLLQKCGMKNISGSMLRFNKTKDLRVKFTELCNELGIYPVIRKFDPIGRGEENYNKLKITYDKKTEKLDVSKYKKISSQKDFKKILPSISSCNGAYREFQIDQKGDLFPCASLMGQEYFMGNLLKIENLKEYIEKKYYMDTEGYKRFDQFKPYKFYKCKDCNKNLMCFTCVRQLIRTIEANRFEEICAENKQIHELCLEV